MLEDGNDLEREEYENNLQSYLEMEGSKLISKEDFDILSKDLDEYEKNKKA